jgi:hypothetical protein
MLNWAPARNEFIDALVNRIGMEIYRYNSWTNPLGKFKRGMLNFGDTIEEINVGLLTAKLYDTDRESLEQDIFGQEKPDVQSSFHKINRQNFYKLTVNETLLARAFLDDMGLSGFVSQLMEAPSTSDNWDEFLLMTSLFAEYDRAGGFFYVNSPDVGSTGSVQADAQNLLRSVRSIASTLPFISTYYNASGMPVAAQPDELELFITPAVNAALDVNALAAAFNIDKADLPGRTTIIPQENFIQGAQALLTTRDFFVVADSKLETTSAINPVGLHTNYFLHHHQVISASRFVPAVLFTTGAGTVITVSPTPVASVSTPTITDSTGATVTSVTRGNLYQINAAAVTSPVGGANDAVRYVLTGAQSPRTFILQTGVLHVGPDEAGTSLTITVDAVSSPDSGSGTPISVQLTAAVVGDKLELWPSPQVESDNAPKDGVFEVTPKPVPAAPTSGAKKNVVVIPTTEGIDYKDGATVVSGQTITLTANKTITAVAQTGYILASGAVSSWSLVFTA